MIAQIKTDYTDTALINQCNLLRFCEIKFIKSRPANLDSFTFWLVTPNSLERR